MLLTIIIDEMISIGINICRSIIYLHRARNNLLKTLCTTVTVFLKCSIINSCCFSKFIFCRVTKTVWKNILSVLESSGEVLEFRMSNIVGTLLV